MLCKNRYRVLFRAIAIGIVCLFLFNDLAFAFQPQDRTATSCLAPTSRFKPLVEIVFDEAKGKYIVVENPKEMAKLDWTDFQENIALLFLSELIGQALYLGLSPHGTGELIEKYFKKTFLKKELAELRKIYKWKELYEKDGAYCLKYVRKDGKGTQILKYYKKDQKPDGVSIPMERALVVLEDPLEDEKGGIRHNNGRGRFKDSFLIEGLPARFLPFEVSYHRDLKAAALKDIGGRLSKDLMNLSEGVMVPQIARLNRGRKSVPIGYGTYQGAPVQAFKIKYGEYRIMVLAVFYNKRPAAFVLGPATAAAHDTEFYDAFDRWIQTVVEGNTGVIIGNCIKDPGILREYDKRLFGVDVLITPKQQAGIVASASGLLLGLSTMANTRPLNIAALAEQMTKEELENAIICIEYFLSHNGNGAGSAVKAWVSVKEQALDLISREFVSSSPDCKAMAGIFKFIAVRLEDRDWCDRFFERFDRLSDEQKETLRRSLHLLTEAHFSELYDGYLARRALAEYDSGPQRGLPPRKSPDRHRRSPRPPRLSLATAIPAAAPIEDAGQVEHHDTGAVIAEPTSDAGTSVASFPEQPVRRSLIQSIRELPATFVTIITSLLIEVLNFCIYQCFYLPLGDKIKTKLILRAVKANIFFNLPSENRGIILWILDRLILYSNIYSSPEKIAGAIMNNFAFRRAKGKTTKFNLTDLADYRNKLPYLTAEIIFALLQTQTEFATRFVIKAAQIMGIDIRDYKEVNPYSREGLRHSERAFLDILISVIKASEDRIAKYLAKNPGAHRRRSPRADRPPPPPAAGRENGNHTGFGIRMSKDANAYKKEDEFEGEAWLLKSAINNSQMPNNYGKHSVDITIGPDRFHLDATVHNAVLQRLPAGLTIQQFIENCINIRAPTDEARKAFLGNLVKNLNGKPLIIDAVNRSPNLYGNCKQDHYCYINLNAPKEMDVIGVSHELMHEAGEKDEEKLLKQDIVLMSRVGIRLSNIPEKVKNLLEPASPLLLLLLELHTAPSADDRKIDTAVKLQPEEIRHIPPDTMQEIERVFIQETKGIHSLIDEEIRTVAADKRTNKRVHELSGNIIGAYKGLFLKVASGPGKGIPAFDRLARDIERGNFSQQRVMDLLEETFIKSGRFIEFVLCPIYLKELDSFVSVPSLNIYKIHSVRQFDTAILGRPVNTMAIEIGPSTVIDYTQYRFGRPQIIAAACSTIRINGAIPIIYNRARMREQLTTYYQERLYYERTGNLTPGVATGIPLVDSIMKKLLVKQWPAVGNSTTPQQFLQDNYDDFLNLVLRHEAMHTNIALSTELAPHLLDIAESRFHWLRLFDVLRSLFKPPEGRSTTEIRSAAFILGQVLPAIFRNSRPGSLPNIPVQIHMKASENQGEPGRHSNALLESIPDIPEELLKKEASSYLQCFIEAKEAYDARPAAAPPADISVRVFTNEVTVDGSGYDIDRLLREKKIQIGNVEGLEHRRRTLPTVMARAGDANAKRFTFKKALEATRDFLQKNNHENLVNIVSAATGSKVTPSDINGPIDIIISKSGLIEFIFQLVIRVKERQEPVLVALHIPVDTVANSLITKDYNNLSYLKEQVKTRHIPANYMIGTGKSGDGTVMNIYANEWMTGYIEPHLRIGINENRFVMWTQCEGEPIHIPISKEEMRDIALQIYSVVTLHNEINLRSVELDAGDVIVKRDEKGPPDTCVVAARSIDKTPHISYDKKQSRVIVREAFDYLAQLLSLRVSEDTCYYPGEEAWRLPRSMKHQEELLVRIADFDTVLQGFHAGVEERLAADGLPGKEAEDHSTQTIIKILESFKDRLATGDIPAEYAYVRKNKDEVIESIGRYLEKIRDKAGQTAGVLTHAALPSGIKSVIALGEENKKITEEELKQQIAGLDKEDHVFGIAIAGDTLYAKILPLSTAIGMTHFHKEIMPILRSIQKDPKYIFRGYTRTNENKITFFLELSDPTTQDKQGLRDVHIKIARFLIEQGAPATFLLGALPPDDLAKVGIDTPLPATLGELAAWPLSGEGGQGGTERDMKGDDAQDSDVVARDLMRKGNIVEIEYNDDKKALKAWRVKDLKDKYRVGVTPETEYRDGPEDIERLLTKEERMNLIKWISSHTLSPSPGARNTSFIRFRISLDRAALQWTNDFDHSNIAHAGYRDRCVYIGEEFLKLILRNGQEGLRKDILDDDEYWHLIDAKNIYHVRDEAYKLRKKRVEEAIAKLHPEEAVPASKSSRNWLYRVCEHLMDSSEDEEVRGVAQKTGLSIGNTLDAMEKLIKLGIVETVKEEDKAKYKITAACPPWELIRPMIMGLSANPMREEIEYIAEKIKNIIHVRKVYANPSPSGKTVTVVAAATHTSNILSPSSFVRNKSLCRAIARKIGEGQKGKKVLSVGIGPGILERELREAWRLKITGVDVIEPMLAIARKNNKGRIALKLASGEHLPFDDESFDIVVLPESIGHMELSMALAEAYRVLKPGGIIHITTIGPTGTDWKGSGYKRYSVDEILLDMKRHGFKNAEPLLLHDAKINDYLYVKAEKPRASVSSLRAPIVRTARDLARMSEAAKNITLGELFKPDNGLCTPEQSRKIIELFIKEERTIYAADKLYSVLTDTSIPAYIRIELHNILFDEFIESYYKNKGENSGNWYTYGKTDEEEGELEKIRNFFKDILQFEKPCDILDRLIEKTESDGTTRLNVLKVKKGLTPLFDAHASPRYGINICSTCEDKGAAIVHELMALSGFTKDLFNSIVEQEYKKYREEGASYKLSVEFKESVDRAIEELDNKLSEKALSEFCVTDIYLRNGEEIERPREVGISSEDFEQDEMFKEFEGFLNRYRDLLQQDARDKDSGALNEEKTIAAELNEQIDNFLPALVATCNSEEMDSRQRAEDLVTLLINICALDMTIKDLDLIFMEFVRQNVQIGGRVKRAFEEAYLSKWEYYPCDKGTDILEHPEGREDELMLRQIAILIRRGRFFDKYLNILTAKAADGAYAVACGSLRQYLKMRAKEERESLKQGNLFKLNIYTDEGDFEQSDIGRFLMFINDHAERFMDLGIELNAAEKAYLNACLETDQQRRDNWMRRFSREVLYMSADERDLAKMRRDEPAAAAAIDIPRAQEIARDFADAIILQAIEAKKKNERIIIGEETGMIPDLQLPYIQELLNYLSNIARKEGLDNIIITRRKGRALAYEISRRIKEASEEKMSVPLKNIIIIGRPQVITSKAFDRFKNTLNPKEGALFAGVKLPDGFSGDNYLPLLDMITVALKLAFGEDVSPDNPFVKFIKDKKNPRLYHFIPKAVPCDYNLLKKIYDAQRETIRAA